MESIFTISNSRLSLRDLDQVLRSNINLSLSENSRKQIVKCREYLDQKLAASSTPIYGINTGFGSLYNKNIPKDQLEKLQENLVKSHACGTGPEVPADIVMLMLFLKIQSLSYGYSGVQVETVQRLIEMFNNRVWPRIYEMGSLGASGDLAPLAHLSLTLIGLGEVHHKGEVYPGEAILKKFGWDKIHFKAKEGLALLNGTQFMSAYGTWSLLHAHRLLKLANLIGALSLDGFDGRLEPFDEDVHKIRPHNGQLNVAKEITELLAGSTIAVQSKKHVQDPYSFRCIPQVHGASYDAIQFVTQSFLTEINSVSDNPNVFADADKIISAGNFHGQPLALPLDFLAIALAELGNISERRTYQLISGSRDLPNYLVADPGINSGLMIPQYTAASLVSQNKQLCTPASVDSIVSSNGQEDHVSMGANAATKVYRVVNNLYSILAIELITAAQALHFRRPLTSSPQLEEFVNTFRQVVPFIETDRELHIDIVAAENFLKQYALKFPV
ncbi:MAG TPA: histidine ammonia-lyase [Cyclobacteriaceae bacterium]|jgi:histidine ammonia-lyase|nr:histidine ammonia-lyase [Cytophagales bacterium]HMR56471.1 histidine ammonia-lyase [Cyclobacteriaceae bacterium]HNT49416.1 histidine ammonia-lyase [Cyclobacteriaceae bacterium]HRE66744.1 histidine ammonia-lyase [Cyclobacteriaceae bacterium]HRF33558.1 histidine ammonia-lyase [Cyclobacteriaceae bacterium]